MGSPCKGGADAVGGGHERRSAPSGPETEAAPRRQQRELLVNAQFFTPARVQLVGVARERGKRSGEFLVLLGVGDRVGARLPALVGLAQRDRTGGRRIDVAVGATTRGVDHVAVAQVFKEARQTQRVHAARDDRGGGLHAVPLLVVDRALGFVALDHVGDVLVRIFAFHLAVAHGPDVDAGCPLKT